jgi:hypothetical protein
MQPLKPSSQLRICCKTFQKNLNVSCKLICCEDFQKIIFNIYEDETKYEPCEHNYSLATPHIIKQHISWPNNGGGT